MFAEQVCKDVVIDAMLDMDQVVVHVNNGTAIKIEQCYGSEALSCENWLNDKCDADPTERCLSSGGAESSMDSASSSSNGPETRGRKVNLLVK